MGAKRGVFNNSPINKSVTRLGNLDGENAKAQNYEIKSYIC